MAKAATVMMGVMRTLVNARYYQGVVGMLILRGYKTRERPFIFTRTTRRDLDDLQLLVANQQGLHYRDMVVESKIA